MEAAASANDMDLLAPSRCAGWAAVEVVVHVRVGLQEMLGGILAVTDRASRTGRRRLPGDLAVELAVHHLDLGRDAHFGSPTADALALGRSTVEALVGAPLPPEWSDETCLLAGAGRMPPPDTPRLPHGVRPLPVLG